MILTTTHIVYIYMYIRRYTWRSRVVKTRPQLYLQPKIRLANSVYKGLISGFLLLLWPGYDYPGPPSRAYGIWDIVHGI